MAPLFTFGVLADIQYGDKDNNNYENRVQRYRESLGKLSSAIEFFNSQKDRTQFILTLGDIIDGNVNQEQTSIDFEAVMKEFGKVNKKTNTRKLILSDCELEVEPVYHILGNHCLSLPRSFMLKRLSMPHRYYQQALGNGYRLVVLDSMDMSIKWEEDTVNFKECKEFQKLHPLGSSFPHMQVWNGGIGSEHKSWLKQTMEDAEKNKERIIVALHHPLVEFAASPIHLLWNHLEISEMMIRSPAVVLVLAGHYHPGGYAFTEGTHFVTVPAILEAPPDSVAHSLVEVFENEIRVIGHGTVPSKTLQIEKHY